MYSWSWESLKSELCSSNVLYQVCYYCRVVENSPAHQAGLRPGDIVTHINESPVHGTRDVYKVLESPGEVVLTLVNTMGKVVSVRVRPEEGH